MKQQFLIISLRSGYTNQSVLTKNWQTLLPNITGADKAFRGPCHLNHTLGLLLHLHVFVVPCPLDERLACSLSPLPAPRQKFAAQRLLSR